uniref:Uncharacterized protein n=1 Tax=Alexandrium monilatum TaxID=311494 RepID=A0A7S4RZA4_9DINO|mmetsp:Transcript_7455/g.23544  ORF Transcript_7455/g.23544 Transcript_7455/m.23544 type:complete len:108 (-) Transcript_7455:20-343(-)
MRISARQVSSPVLCRGLPSTTSAFPVTSGPPEGGGGATRTGGASPRREVDLDRASRLRTDLDRERGRDERRRDGERRRELERRRERRRGGEREEERPRGIGLGPSGR